MKRRNTSVSRIRLRMVSNILPDILHDLLENYGKTRYSAQK